MTWAMTETTSATSSQFIAYAVCVSVSSVLLVLDVINPPPNAARIEATKIDNRFSCREDTASLFSLLSFGWVDGLLQFGRTKVLEGDDLHHVRKDDQMDNVVRAWKKFHNKPNNVIWDLIWMTKEFLFFQISVSFITSTLSFSTPFFINRILNWIQSRDPENDDMTYGTMLLFGMFLSSIALSLLNAQLNLSGRRWGMRLKAVLVHEIYSKSLRRAEKTIPTKENEEEEEKNVSASQGKIVNLMSSDTNSIRSFITDIHSLLVDTPLSIILSISGLLYLMGPPALAGLAVIIISGPMSGIALASLYKIMKQTRAFQDRRLQVTNEALQGIRIIKYMAWEPQFIDKISKAREDELNSRFKQLLNHLVIIFISWGSSILVTFVSFFFYTVVAGKQLDAATAFTSITLLSEVSMTLNTISETVTEVMTIRVTMSRIFSYLAEEELECFTNETEASGLQQPAKEAVGFEQCNFTHYRDDASIPSSGPPAAQSGDSQGLSEMHTFFLRDVNINFPINKLSVIIGPTGAGKSSLLSALLGEMRKLSGTQSLYDNETKKHGRLASVAYVTQTSWLLNKSIRSNILFGEPFDEERYLKVISACSLVRDLNTFEAGDLTEIGEKGVNLSGGQKQRVALARAAYSKANIILLDDPLSAVDAPTARHLFHECILGLLKDKTVILVTHAASLVVPLSDHVVVLKSGQVVSSGPPSEITDNTELQLLISNRQAVVSNVTIVDDDDEPETIVLNHKPTRRGSGNVGQLVQREHKSAGSIKWPLYISYIGACGGAGFLVFVFVGFLTTNTADFLSSWWIERWTDYISNTLRAGAGIIFATFTSITTRSFQMAKDTDLKTPYAASNGNQGVLMVNDSLYYISIFGLISIVELFSLIFKFVVQFLGAMRGSRVLHKNILEAVLYSPLRFFETTPVGRIINRFSNDLNEIDRGVMPSLIRFFTLSFGAFVRIGIVTYVTPPFLFSVVFFYVYYRLAQHYLITSRELKRIESVSSSPVYAHFSQTLNGVSTIRAYGAEDRITKEIESKVDANHRAYFYLFATNRWLFLRTSVISAFIVFGAGLSIIMTRASAGWAGVAFNFANEFTRMMARLIQSHSSMEMSMNAIERVQEYSALKREPYEPIGDYRPPDGWPSHGKVQVDGLTVRYAPDLPNVLKNVSFISNNHEKLGIVGRTGAGKSTLSAAFFRILPFVSGSIIIDGIDVSELGLQDLRSRLTIIPQDPIVFEGSIRTNLDPLNEHDDAAIWEAIRLTNLLESLQIQQSGSDDAASAKGQPKAIHLDSHVAENGRNFSQGQKQLMCLARALLRSSRLIFLDEATASVDSNTDARIQETIRTQFTEATVLTVAHRLKTVIDYDRIIVMDNGEVAEIGTPYELIEMDGIFASMCRESGEYDELARVAFDCHFKGN